MAIEAKMNFLNALEQSLSSILTSSDMAKTLKTISDQLSVYDMFQVDLRNSANDDLLNAFLSAMQIEGRSPKTIERYTYMIKRMMEEVKVPTRQITVYHLRQYLASEKERGISDRTLESTRQIFSAYFNWLQRECLIERNPIANLGAIKYAKKVKSVYTDVDIERLKQKCTCVRDRAILCFLLSTGCRISEMTELNRDSIDLSNLECIVHGKGDKERTVYMSEVAGMLLKEYLQTRNDDNPALFLNRNHERIAPGGVRFMLNSLADEAKVDHVHPHKFRRTLATNLIKHGMPIQEVASILGHDKLDTTMQYVVLDKTTVKNSYRRFT